MSDLEDRMPDRTARGLGWTSLALAVPPLVAPRALTRALGLSGTGDGPTVARAVGVQELLVGAGLVAGVAKKPLLWTRVAGDALHLGLLGKAMTGSGGTARTRAAAASVAGIAAVDLVAAVRQALTGSASPRPLELTAVTTVNRPPQEVYDFWRGFERLPRFLQHLEQVEWLDGTRTRWTARAPGKEATVSWDAELVDDVRGERISWRSLPGATVPNEGTVTFTPAPGGKGTEVRVDLRYSLPGGRAGQAVARLLGEEPHQQVEDDLRRFKQVMETGEVVRSDGSPEGTSASRQMLQRPAQPMGAAR